jgi:DNA-damage-inducible protein J
MTANALVQARIDQDVKDRAAAVLQQMGLSVSDAVRIMLTRTANEGAVPFDLQNDGAAHDAWFRMRVREALAEIEGGQNPLIDEAEWKQHAQARRADLKQRMRALE